MSEFSILLKKYLDEEGVSCRKAAALCQMDRTSLNKYLIGSRRPMSVEVVKKIANGLGMDGKDTSLLCEAYEQDIKNEKKDVIYQAIENLFVKKRTAYEEISVQPAADEAGGGKQTCSLNSREEILFRMNEVLCNASTVKLCCSMDCPEVIDILRKNSAAHGDCTIEHMIEVESGNMLSDKLLPHFELLASVLLSDCSYAVHYRNHWNEPVPGVAPQANYIITDEAVLVFNEALSCGIVSFDKRYCSYYQKKFERLYKESRLFADNRTQWALKPEGEPWQYACNPDSGIEYAYAGETGEAYVIDRAAYGGEHMFCVREERMADRILEFIEQVGKQP